MFEDDRVMRQFISDTVKETLLHLGFDASNPLELQADMAYLRERRLQIQDIKSKSTVGVLVFIGVSIITYVYNHIASLFTR